jgi:hypothetical protein
MKRITIQVKYNYWAFTELAESMKDAILEYGIDCVVNYGVIADPSDFMIHIFGKGINVPESEICVIFETDHKDFPLRQRAPINYKDDWTRSLHFFDYGEDLTSENIYYCPVGYSKYFDTDLLRRDIRKNYHMGRGPNRIYFRSKYNLWTPEKPVVGEERDNLIVSSKVNINSRKYDDYCFTPLHAALIIHKGKLYMEEEYNRNDYNWYKDYMILYTDETFRDKLNYWTHNDKERKDFEAFVHNEVKTKHRFEKYFYAAISDLLDSYK